MIRSLPRVRAMESMEWLFTHPAFLIGALATVVVGYMIFEARCRTEITGSS